MKTTISKITLITAATVMIIICSTGCKNNQKTENNSLINNNVDSTCISGNSTNQDKFTVSQNDTTSPVTISNNAKNINNNEPVYDNVDVYPIFKGGMENLPKFLKANLTYPESARSNNIQGEVKVSFIVEKDGSITNINIIQGFNKACEDESVRVVSLFPNWTPGKKDGKVVRTRLTLPLKFSLQK